MNNAIISVQIVQQPQLRYTSDNQTPVAEALVESLPLRDGDPPATFKSTVWGDRAADFAALKEGQSLILDGRLGINSIDRSEGFKEKKPEFSVSHWHLAPLVSLNRIALVGRVGGDCDTKYFESGSVICTFTLAVNRRTKNSDQPDWFNVETWGKTAQVAADYVHKGSLIGISGSLKVEQWTDRNTAAPRSKPIIRVDRLDLLGSKSDRQDPPAYDDYQYAQPVASKGRSMPASVAADPSYDEIPF